MREDRILLTRAPNDEKARRIVERECRKQDHTYVGADYDLVRWNFEDVLHVNRIGRMNFKDPVIEVYYALKQRKLGPGLIWPPPPRRAERGR